MKKSLHLAHYKFNKNDNNDKNNYSFPSETTTHYKSDDDNTESTENLTNTSFDSYDNNYNKVFAFTSTNRPLMKINSDQNKYGNSTPWNLKTQKIDNSNNNRFDNCPS